MNKGYKGKVKYILASAVMPLFVIITMTAVAGNFISPSIAESSLSNTSSHIITDTIPIETNKTDSFSQRKITDTTVLKDTTLPKVDTFNVKIAKDSLDAPIVYHAEDSMVLDVPDKKIYLYGKHTEAKYKDNDLTAPGMVFDQENNLITASLKKDSAGKVIAFPAFNQGDFKSVSDTIKFNPKTGKGITKGTYTQEGDMYIYGETIKKVSPDVFYAFKGRFTTCDLDTPHFAFVSNKIKFINNKMAITGPVHPEFEGVPIPIYLPFGIFPLTQGRHSGILAPTFSSNEQLGISLTNFGYYKVLSDNWDITTKGSVYSYGSWAGDVATTYYKRYHYRGTFDFNYQNIKSNFKGDPDYSVAKTFQVNWSHTMDTKARPGVSFSANVHAGSTSFNSSVPNNPQLNFNNQLYSTISFSKVWKDKPFNISISANHDQDAVSKKVDVALPNLCFGINTLYPFRQKEQIGPMKWYENIGIGLQSQGNSRTYFYDDTSSAYYLGTRSIGTQISNNFQWGVSHSVPITLSLPPISVVQISPNVSYAEHWYDRQSFQNWNNTTGKIDTTINRGFYTARNISFGVGVATKLFGIATFGKNSYIQAIHQQITPSISLSYSPDLNGQYYRRERIDSAGDSSSYSLYNGSIAGAFGAGRFGGLSFSLADIIQMKVKSKTDTGQSALKKVSLLDNLNLTGSYNFLADSFQLSIINANASTNLFNKINLTASAYLDPYETNDRGIRIQRLLWKDNPISLGRLTSANIALSTQFKGGSDKKSATINASGPVPNPGQLIDPNTGLPITDYQAEALYQNNTALYTDFSVPWSLSLSYSFQYTKAANPGYSSVVSTVSQNINWNGTLGLTPKWQIGINGSYNLTAAQLGMLSMSLTRDMHCWRMAITISPVYPRFFTITISPVSSLLKDVKYNRSRYFY
jgi:lipopolysaccharide transport LptD-like protein